MQKTPKVSLVKSPDSYSGVSSALKIIEKDLILALKGKKRVVIKPNMVSIRHPLASTPVEAVRAVLDFLKPLVKQEIIIAEGSAENTEKGFKKLRFYDLAKDYKPSLKSSLRSNYKIKFVDLNKDVVGKFAEASDSVGNPLKIGIAKAITEADFIISVTRPKTWHQTESVP